MLGGNYSFGSKFKLLCKLLRMVTGLIHYTAGSLCVLVRLW